MTERNYMPHSAEECFGERSNQKYIRYGLVGPMKIRSEAVKQWKKYKYKRKKYLKDIKKHNKMLNSIAKKTGSLHEIKKIQKIKAKNSKNHRDDSSNFSSDESDYNSSLSSDIN